jgi:D-3-phosphoglycerate dehydrogenase
MSRGVLIYEPQNYSLEAIKIYESIAPVWRFGIDSFDAYDVGCLVVRLAHFIDQEFIEPFPNLRALVSPTTGITHIDMQACQRKGIRVFTLRECKSKLEKISSTAEHTLCLILSLVRQLPQAHSSIVDRGEWNRDKFCSRQLSSLRLGIVGLGRIGRWMARYGKSIGMEVAAYDPYVTSQVFENEDIDSLSLDELCRRSDILTIHANLTSENDSLINKDLLNLLPKGAYLINTSRGELIDESIAAEMVRESKLGGVAVDVLRNEHDYQCITNSPLIKAARDGFNVLVTPHVGGCTSDSMRITEDLMANVLVESFPF